MWPCWTKAGDGASHLSTQDRGHCFDTLEKGGTFRRRTTEAASSLSVTQNSGDPRFSCLGGGPSVLRRSGSRESIHTLIRRRVLPIQHRVSGSILCPLIVIQTARFSRVDFNSNVGLTGL